MANDPPPDAPLVTRIITRPDRTTALQLRRCRLLVTSGPDRGTALDLPTREVEIGSAPGCDLVLSDPAVSRRHFALAVRERGFVLRDLGSKNGTRVGGLRIGEVELAGGEEILAGQSKLRLELQEGNDEIPLSSRTTFGGLLGRSLAMRQVFAVLERAAGSDVTVLLLGESGTGKDLAAETLHATSGRRTGPFVVVDCATMGSNLVASELFGHHKGAYTGAEADRAGAFETAHGGTVFLDEVGELDGALQQNLLRFLEKREFKRLGENNYRHSNARVIAATNRDLRADVAGGRFRQDLFYRLSVLQIRMPALRERREDIGLLARAFVQKLQPQADPLTVVSEPVLALLANHDWPGNVRELRNVVERLLLFPDRPGVALEETGSADPADADLFALPFHEARQRWNDRFEKTYLTSLLDAHGGVVARAARAAGIPRQTFHRLMAKHGLAR